MLQIVDTLLLLGATLRLSRLVTTDTLGEWWLIRPAYRWADWNRDVEPIGHRQRLVSGLECPFCVGFWIGVVLTASLYLVGGAGDAAEWWRWAAGILTLNYVAGHIAARLDS